MLTEADLIATTYQPQKQFTDMNPSVDVKFTRMNSPFYKGEKWSVRNHSLCLNKDSEWEFEPSPSSRDDAFYARCRFDSLAEAIEIYNSSL